MERLPAPDHGRDGHLRIVFRGMRSEPGGPAQTRSARLLFLRLRRTQQACFGNFGGPYFQAHTEIHLIAGIEAGHLAEREVRPAARQKVDELTKGKRAQNNPETPLRVPEASPESCRAAQFVISSFLRAQPCPLVFFYPAPYSGELLNLDQHAKMMLQHAAQADGRARLPAQQSGIRKKRAISRIAALAQCHASEIGRASCRE